MQLTWYQEKKTEFILFSLLQFGLLLFMFGIPVLFLIGVAIIIYALVQIHQLFMNSSRYHIFVKYILALVVMGVVMGILSAITNGSFGIYNGNVSEVIWPQLVMGAVSTFFQMWFFRSMMAQETKPLFYQKDIKILSIIICVQIIATILLPVILLFVVGAVITIVIIEYLYREHKENSH